MRKNTNLIFLFLSLYLISYTAFSQEFYSDKNMIYVKGGKFYLGNKSGDEDEQPKRKVFVNDFYIGKYEVTNKEYCDFLNAVKPDAQTQRKYINLDGEYKNIKCGIFLKDSVYFTEKGYEYYPVIFVTWFGADAYCKYAGGRLPAEAEWEYAAKGGKMSSFIRIFRKYRYSGSNNPDKVAWFRDNSEGKPKRTGTKKPNRLQLYDMSGNVAEWCSDWYDTNYYKICPDKNPQGPENGRMKVHRGGSWYNTPEMLRVTNRRASKPVNQNAVTGFRIAKDIAGFCPVK